MARKSSNLLGWLIVLGGGYYTYLQIEAGHWLPQLRPAADAIHDSLGGLGLSWFGKTPGVDSGGNTKPATQGTMLAGRRYVAPDGAGKWIVVWAGTDQGHYATQAIAEGVYNTFIETRGLASGA